MEESGHFALIEMLLAFGAILAIGVWQLVSVRRALREPSRRDRDTALPPESSDRGGSVKPSDGASETRA